MYYPIIPHYPREAWLLSNDMFETQCNQSDIQGWDVIAAIQRYGGLSVALWSGSME